jgi:nicotinamidase-related amidase
LSNNELEKMLLNPEKTLLLIVDIQEKLYPLQQEKETFLKNVKFILDAAKRLNVRVEATEQYPKGLGHTIPEIREKLTKDPIEKTDFSCGASLQLDCEQIVICGMEASICVLQTALDFKAKGVKTFVAGDAITGRLAYDKEIAMMRMVQAGIIPVTTEMVVYEWMRNCLHPGFKDINQLMKNK